MSYQYLNYLKFIKSQKIPPVYFNASNDVTSKGPISFSNNVIGLSYTSPIIMKNNLLTLDLCANYIFDGPILFNNEMIQFTNIPLVSGDTYHITIDPSSNRLAYQTYSGLNIEPNSIIMNGTGNIDNVKIMNGNENSELVIKSSGSGGSLLLKTELDNIIKSLIRMDNFGTIFLDADYINIGNSNSVVNILGTQSIAITSTVSDQVIILNKGGNLQSSYGSGIQIEANLNSSAGFIKVDSVGNNFDVKVPNKATVYKMMLKESNGNISMTGNLSINTNRFIFNSNNGDMLVGGTASILNNLQVNGGISTSGACYIAGRTDVLGETHLNGTLTSITGTLNVANSATITGTLNTQGMTTSTGIINNGNLSVSGGTSFGGVVNMGGSLSVTGISTLTGNTTIGSNLTIASLTGGGTTSASFDNSGNLIRTISDKRMKKDISTLSNNNDIIENFYRLNPVQYKWIDENKYGSQHKYGFLANEVQEIYPDMVYKSFTDINGIDYLGFSQESLVPILTAVLQDKSRKIKEQEEEISLLKQKLDTFEERLNAIEKLINSDTVGTM